MPKSPKSLTHIEESAHGYIIFRIFYNDEEEQSCPIDKVKLQEDNLDQAYLIEKLLDREIKRPLYFIDDFSAPQITLDKRKGM